MAESQERDSPGRSIPSILSLLRLLAAPFVVVAILRGENRFALLLCVAAGATDFLDGYLARSRGWITRSGAWLDAVADKVLLSSVFVAFWMIGAVPGWLVSLILGRDILILVLAGAGLLFTSIRDFPPSVWGKLSTNVQIAVALVLLADLVAARQAAIFVCTLTTGWSGLHYFYSALLRLREMRHSAD